MNIMTGNTIKENKNRFTSYAPTADSLKRVLMFIFKIMKQTGRIRCLLQYMCVLFLTNDDITHEESMDDGKGGARRNLLQTFTENYF